VQQGQQLPQTATNSSQCRHGAIAFHVTQNLPIRAKDMQSKIGLVSQHRQSTSSV